MDVRDINIPPTEYAHVVVVVFISTVQHRIVSTAIDEYNTDIMES